MSEGKEIVLSIDGVEIGRSVMTTFEPVNTIPEAEIKIPKGNRNAKKIAAYYHGRVGSVNGKPVMLVFNPRFYFEKGKRHLRWHRTNK